jgi:GPH family glycoside/pentoside/hexuronide:cation symporter
MKLSYWQKVLYSSGSLGVALSYQAFAFYIQFLYIDRLGLKATLVGAGWAVYGIWNAVNDPLAGYWSDRTRTRLGRRIPWILTAFIPLGLFFYLLWVPPAPVLAGGETPLFIYFIGVVLVFDLLWTIVAMNWTSLFPEMISDEKERATVSGWRQFFSVIGLLVGVALPPILAGADWSGRQSMALLFAVITVAALGVSLLGSREPPATAAAPQPPFIPAMRATLQNRAFRWFLGANLSKEFIYSLIGASIPFWAKYVLLVQAPVEVAGVTLGVEVQNSIILGLAFVMALPGLPVWTAVAKRVGARRGWQISQATFALSMVLLFFTRNFYEGAMATALVGLSLAGLLVFPDLLISDVIDEDELSTGARREGMYFGVNGFIIRFGFTLQGLATGTILGLTGYVASTNAVLYPAQPAAAVLGLRVLTAGLPLLASLVVIACLAFYPLHGRRLAHVRERQAALRLAAAAAAGD